MTSLYVRRAVSRRWLPATFIRHAFSPGRRLFEMQSLLYSILSYCNRENNALELVFDYKIRLASFTINIAENAARGVLTVGDISAA